ncbi:hypothetical protein BIY24_14725 [Halobacteriovorax marinus]|uniref:DUF1501 domain-containing protein n=1 Tax=Halobacteriovorax marinus TaxID=97084 RepID=UPI000BC2EE0A|nr:DUF1501 domain-containing protein [Halobacteriovorax marinus]ATH09151.1 hypothetical protein BIY24_14725 [Halobacteriovorax marinus]
MKIKRRHFLTFTSLLALYPLNKFFQRNNQKSGRDKRTEYKKYILLNVVESPSRWMFDTILRPTNNDKFIENQFIATGFAHIGQEPLDFSYEYKTFPHRGMNFPVMWNQSLPDSKGGSFVLKELAENMLIVRGCNMIFDGHEINSKRLDAPSIGDYSITGLHDHTSPGLFPCLSLEGVKESGTAAQAYHSPSKNRIPIKHSHNHYVDYLLDSFLNSKEDDSSDALLEEILAQKFRRDHIGDFIKNLRQKKKIRNFVKENYSLIKKDYERAISKYQNLIDRSIRETRISNLTDKRIPGIKFPLTLKKRVHKDKTPFDIVDYIGAYKQGDRIIIEDDIRDIFKTAEIKELAKQMSLTEIALKYDLTNNIVMNISAITEMTTKTISLDDLEIKSSGDKVTISKKKEAKEEVLKISHEADSHETGSISTLVCDYLMWRAVASCTHELINRIKEHGKSQWENTLIHLTTEFEREPGEIDKGSHHGFTGHTSTFFSGSIKETSLIGNIYSISHDQTDVSPGCGTWGKGAPVDKLGNREMVYGNIATSIADFLGCPSPMPHEPRIFKLDNGRIHSLVEAPTNKEFTKQSLKFEKPATT